jgi:hypothetical protein
LNRTSLARRVVSQAGGASDIKSVGLLGPYQPEKHDNSHRIEHPFVAPNLSVSQFKINKERFKNKEIIFQ